MARYFDVTLVGIYGGTHNGKPHEISGRLYAKILNRDHIEMRSHEMFVSDTPIKINEGDMLTINKEIRESVAEDNLDMNLLGEYLAIGGTLLGGTLSDSPRYILIHSFNLSNPNRKFRVHFGSYDTSQWVEAEFNVKFAHDHL